MSKNILETAGLTTIWGGSSALLAYVMSDQIADAPYGCGNDAIMPMMVVLLGGCLASWGTYKAWWRRRNQLANLPANTSPSSE